MLSVNLDRLFSAVDLFAGAGGLTISLEQAGFQTVTSVDNNADAIATLTATQRAKIRIPDRPGRTYLSGTRILSSDMADLEPADLRPPGAPRNWRPDVLAGGPPCQPFSSAGRQSRGRLRGGHGFRCRCGIRCGAFRV